MDVLNALKSAVIVLMILLAGQLNANAGSQQDYCIKCTNPDLTYICRVVSDSSQARGKQFFCIMNIAKEQGHDSCTATAQSQVCSGVLIQYDVSGIPAPPPPTEEANAPIAQPERQVLKKGAPKTLVEFTKQATKATTKGLKSAGSDTKKVFKNTGKAIKKTGNKIKKFTNNVGSNIKSATKTTLQCIASLFFNCGED